MDACYPVPVRFLKTLTFKIEKKNHSNEYPLYHLLLTSTLKLYLFFKPDIE